MQQLDSRIIEPSPAHASATAELNETAAADRLKIDTILQELDELVGLVDVKRMVRELRAFVEVQKARKTFQLPADVQSLHMLFSGAPGTGKTTIARLLGRLFLAMQVLPKGHLIEAERADLVGEYIGHTAQKTRELLKKAQGGILFVDEAYSLARGGEKDFGKEAIDTLVKAMEDRRGEFILILAGYSEEMEWFLQTNPGLISRFPIHMHFPDYTPKELLHIAQMMLNQRQYHLAPEAVHMLEEYLTQKMHSVSEHTGNARMVRNLIERAIRQQAVRLMAQYHGVFCREALMRLIWADFEGGISAGRIGDW
ncbi:MAG: AAA family ATPase [Firmicutes bacterium]|nr:AAA family ATPase [Bacillota bacterium]